MVVLCRFIIILSTSLALFLLILVDAVAVAASYVKIGGLVLWSQLLHIIRLELTIYKRVTLNFRTLCIIEINFSVIALIIISCLKRK